MSDLKITKQDVLDAHDRIRATIRKTPTSPAMGPQLHEKQVHFKFENMQQTGSFKLRGSLNKISTLTDAEKKRGVIAASAGNHAQGVALSSQLFSVKSKIVMPLGAPLIKVSATRSYGAEVVLHGHYFDEAYTKAREIADAEDLVFIHPYQDKMVIAGQGTIGLEVLEAIPDLKSIVIPIGGGGLIGGISFIIKQINPGCKIYGVVSDQAPGMKDLKNQSESERPRLISTIADGIAVKNPSQAMFDTFIDPWVDEVVSVNDEEIAQAIVYAMEIEKTILEGSGAAGLAAVLTRKVILDGPSCVLLCGGNIDLNTVSSVIDTGLQQSGRLSRLSVIVNDLPGELAYLTKVFADSRANVLDVVHDRVSPELSLRQTRIDFLLETTSFEHIEKIREKIAGKNIRIVERSF